jgi:hypothetical protein
MFVYVSNVQCDEARAARALPDSIDVVHLKRSAVPGLFGLTA